MEAWRETKRTHPKRTHSRSSQPVHKDHVRHRIKILLVARRSLTISFRKENPLDKLARAQKTPLKWPSFLVASLDERIYLELTGASMSPINLDPLITFPDGSYLVVRTQCSKEGDFSCALYTAVIGANESAAFRIISSHLQASTCLKAQEIAYGHATQLYPRTVDQMKKPPYLIWHGPQAIT
jgi:hypothetical protein